MFEKWETVLFTTRLEVFQTVKGKLTNAGIRHKSRITDHSRTGENTATDRMAAASYEILVLEKDSHKANDIVHTVR